MLTNVPLGNCHKHPDRKAVAACSVCSVAMCEECTLYTPEGRPICHSCMLKLAERENVERKTQEDQALRAELERRKRAKIRNRTLLWTVIAIVSAIVIAAEIMWYKSLSTTNVKGATPLSEAVSDDEALISFVFSAVLLYKDANGRYPDSLDELERVGLLGTKDKPNLSRIRYRRTSDGFELSLVNAKPPLDRMVFTQNGPKTKEVQP